MLNYEMGTGTNSKIRHRMYEKLDYFVRRERLRDIFF